MLETRRHIGPGIPLHSSALFRGWTSEYLFPLALSTLVWGVNAVWLALDTRPPVWDMALPQ